MININNFMSKRYIGVAFIVRYIHRYREMHVFLVYKVHKRKLENQISRDFILLLFYPYYHCPISFFLEIEIEEIYRIISKRKYCERKCFPFHLIKFT